MTASMLGDIGFLFNSEELGATPSMKLEQDEWFMRHALREAMLACGKSEPNPPVGCVLVYDNKIIGFGHTDVFGGKHAETRALDDAVARGNSALIKGSTAYVTLEPCAHYGKQPPCSLALIKAGIKRVVVGSADPNPEVSGRGILQLKSEGVLVSQDILRPECDAWLSHFLFFMKNNSAFVALKWAQTLDGFLSADNGVSKWISGPHSRKAAHWLRQKFDAIVVGANTVIADQPQLTVRSIDKVQARNPVRIVVDLLCGLDNVSDEVLQKKIIQKTFSKDAPTILISPACPPKWLRHCSALQWLATEEHLPLDVLVADFCDRVRVSVPRMQSVMIEGGPHLLRAFINNNSWNSAHVFVGESFLYQSKYKIIDHKLNDQTLFYKASKKLLHEIEQSLFEPNIPKAITGGELFVEINN